MSAFVLLILIIIFVNSYRYMVSDLKIIPKEIRTEIENITIAFFFFILSNALKIKNIKWNNI
jgi:hypothetical protein